MASNSSQLSRFLAKTAGQAQFAMLVLAGAVTFASVAAAADPLEVAVVESISGSISGVDLMDYVRTGQVIQLRPNQTIVLSYEASCVRETITGGTVMVGIDRSEVRSGQVRRLDGPCNAPNKMVLTNAHSEIAVAGRTFRGGPGR